MIDETRVYSKTLAFGLAGVALFYATMTTLQLASGSQPFHKWWLAYPIEAISCFVVIPVLMFLATKFPWAKLPAIVYYHLSLGIVYVWFTEVYSPFTPIWSMYALVASIYFGWKGFIGSILCLYAFSAWYVLAFAGDLKPSFTVYAVLSILVCTITTFTSYLFARVVRNGQDKNIALRKTELLEQQRANQLYALLNSIHEPVMTVDEHGRITSQNSASLVFFNTNESYVGRDIDSVIMLRTRGDNFDVKISQLVASMLSETALREDLVRGDTDKLQYISLQLSRINQSFNKNQPTGFVVVIRDITKQKTLEEEKDEFISVTSHELRTPIAIIEGGISNMELLRSRNVNDGRLDEAIATAHQQIVNLARIVNDISTISRAEKGFGEKVEEIDIDQLMAELQRKYKPYTDQKSLYLRLDMTNELPLIVTSRTYVNEILENFIKNAIKYTKVGGVIVKANALQDGRIFFDVSDSGIGISDADQARIFDKFYRSEDYRTRETSGTGLGLYEAKILATKMDAAIYVGSKLNQGSVFRLVLPLNVIKMPGQRTVTGQDRPQVSQ